jgi:hypothetical protein
MQNLNHDVLIHIFLYLHPEEIKTCYHCFSSILDELFVHVGFQIHCKTIVCDETISWFQEKKIPLYLFHETCTMYNNDIVTKRNFRLHSSNDIPSLFNYKDNIQIWHQNGERHRDKDQPAYIDNDVQMWYQNGQLHRDYDLPAVVEENGTKMWYQRGVLHRDQFAAIIAPTYQEYYKNGCLIFGKYLKLEFGH